MTFHLTNTFFFLVSLKEFFFSANKKIWIDIHEATTIDTEDITTDLVQTHIDQQKIIDQREIIETVDVITLLILIILLHDLLATIVVQDLEAKDIVIQNQDLIRAITVREDLLHPALLPDLLVVLLMDTTVLTIPTLIILEDRHLQ